MGTESKDILDFIIIGAQKSGTTTLFRHLIEHPAIYMPPEKEAPFFSLDQRYEKGWHWFMRGFFANAPRDKLWGKASPQYMGYSQVPERLAKRLPHVKLIAILRAPVIRAYSHYKMNVRRGVEARSFEKAVRTQLSPDALEECRLNPNATNSYVIWGEYGRILSTYLHYFPREQMLILFTENLKLNPENLMRRIYDFLDIEMFLPKTLGQKFHQGGVKQRIPLAANITKIIPVRAVKSLLPTKLMRKLGYWYFRFAQWNTIPDETSQLFLAPEALQALQEHYDADADILKKITHNTPPWLPFPEL